MNNLSGLEALAGGAVVSPFPRLRELLGGSRPGHERPIELTIGEPREIMPDFVIDKLGEAAALYGKYPPIKGTDELRRAIADWVARRYGAGGTAGVTIDPDSQIVPLNGSREGLFYAAFPAVARKLASGTLQTGEKPAMLMPNPFYQTYAGAALACDCQPVYLPATANSGFLPDLENLAANKDLLRRTAAFYLCSPSNPQGAVADAGYLAQALDLARRHDFMLFADECYSEIYSGEPPPGALQVAMSGAGGAVQSARRAGDNDAGGDVFGNLLVFNSLSKRSNLPGLRSGFCLGDRDFIATLLEMRNLIGPQMPLPTQHLSAAIWADERHVEVTRRAYREKFDMADEILGSHYGYRRPAGGFFLWLDMTQWGGGIDATVTLWKGCGVKVLPGAFLAQDDCDGQNPGKDYVRVALVHDGATIREALERISLVLS